MRGRGRLLAGVWGGVIVAGAAGAATLQAMGAPTPPDVRTASNGAWSSEALSETTPAVTTTTIATPAATPAATPPDQTRMVVHPVPDLAAPPVPAPTPPPPAPLPPPPAPVASVPPPPPHESVATSLPAATGGPNPLTAGGIGAGPTCCPCAPVHRVVHHVLHHRHRAAPVPVVAYGPPPPYYAPPPPPVLIPPPLYVARPVLVARPLWRPYPVVGYGGYGRRWGW